MNNKLLSLGAVVIVAILFVGISQKYKPIPIYINRHYPRHIHTHRRKHRRRHRH